MAMDALEFFKERKRMCESSYNKELQCDFCDANSEAGLCMTGQLAYASIESSKRAIEIVEKWSKSHPKKTRLQDFKEKYPNAQFNELGHPKNCCELLGYCECKYLLDVESCKECWNEPVD